MSHRISVTRSNLQAAIDRIWPKHNEGYGGTGDAPWASWEVDDPVAGKPSGDDLFRALMELAPAPSSKKVGA